jgi:hypothetical protein
MCICGGLFPGLLRLSKGHSLTGETATEQRMAISYIFLSLGLSTGLVFPLLQMFDQSYRRLAALSQFDKQFHTRNYFMTGNGTRRWWNARTLLLARPQRFHLAQRQFAAVVVLSLVLAGVLLYKLLFVDLTLDAFLVSIFFVVFQRSNLVTYFIAIHPCVCICDNRLVS